MPMADLLPSELFTWPSLGTLAGSTGATVVVTNAISRATSWNPAWFGLVVANLLSVALAIVSKTSPADYILALLNGCLVYVSAAGTSSVGAAASSPKLTSGLEGIESRRTSTHDNFFSAGCETYSA